MLNVLITFTLVAFPTIFAENQNETSQDKNDYGFVDTGVAFARNLTANFAVSAADLDDKILNFDSEKLVSNVSVSERSENPVSVPDLDNQISNFDDERKDNNVSITNRSKNEEPLLSNKNTIEFNKLKNNTIEPKTIDFRPSPPLETYYEYNQFPVKPVLPEPKMVRNYEAINANDRESYIKGEVLPVPLENERSRNLNGFEPGSSAFGNGDFPHPGRSQSGLSKNAGAPNTNNYNRPSPWPPEYGNNINRKNEPGGNSPWVSRVRFPHHKPTINDNPYSFVPITRTDQNINCCQENPPYLPPNNYYNQGALPPKNNEYLPPTNIPPPSTNNLDSAKNNFNNINFNKVGYLPPTSSYGSTEGGYIETKPKYVPSSFSSSGPNEEFNFNKYVEVPKTYYSGAPNKYPPQTYETSYNLMEKPSSEGHHKTYGGGLSYSPWKKILKLFATFIPIGLLISALTPTVITVTNINDTSEMASTRYRSNDDSKKELTNHILSSLDYFDKLNENGCEYRVFCELLVSASHMPNSAHHVENLLDNFAKHEIDYKSRADELIKVFEAVRNHDCNSVPCEFIKNPT